ncbi:UNVERIFIED_CONTAM: hypothetical protein Sradi_5712400 [Sesamum radiatum]|uniref:Integrase catalytic domain-containing protein n=1 Tax=Sesamum radiatum TaxID=300843 RepID=A0AAW2L4G2_SESRA
MANALANLATTLALFEGKTTNIPVCNRWVLPSLDISDHENSNAITIATNNEEDWRTPLIEYLKHGKLPDDTRYKTEVRRRSSHVILYKDTLYWRSLKATDYFSKWAEAVPLKEVKKETAVDFIRVNIITDNGRPFYNKSMDKLCAQFGFKQHNSSMYNIAANGLAEAFPLQSLEKSSVEVKKGLA